MITLPSYPHARRRTAVIAMTALPKAADAMSSHPYPEAAVERGRSTLPDT